MRSVDVVIVGAGAAGIGMTRALQAVPDIEYEILESGRIGESFHRWPAQTRFITPSFYSNPFGLADLNAVDAVTSPALAAGAEHLSGPQYAEYLRFVAEAAELSITCQCKVLDVTRRHDGYFELETEQGDYEARFVIWACGEYQFPDLNPFPGGQWCLHYANVADWQALEPGHYTVIGGYESGVDAVVNLVRLGHSVRLLVRRATWEQPGVHDPSVALSPYSQQRLRDLQPSGALQIIYGADVVEVSADADGGARIHAADGRYWDSQTPPILGTGFLKDGGATQITDLWSWDESGRIRLSERDESLRTPGLFLVGPQVRHEPLIYCFIYKFRQRFALIAEEIAARLGLEHAEQQQGSWGPFGNAECCEGCQC